MDSHILRMAGCVADPGPDPVGSEHLGLNPNPDPGLNKLLYLNLFGVCKSHKTLRNTCCLTFWFMVPFRALQHFSPKQFPEETLFRSGSRLSSGSGSGRF
jgi:hypothetical protein